MSAVPTQPTGPAPPRETGMRAGLAAELHPRRLVETLNAALMLCL